MDESLLSFDTDCWGQHICGTEGRGPSIGSPLPSHSHVRTFDVIGLSPHVNTTMYCGADTISLASTSLSLRLSFALGLALGSF